MNISAERRAYAHTDAGISCALYDYRHYHLRCYGNPCDSAEGCSVRDAPTYRHAHHLFTYPDSDGILNAPQTCRSKSALRTRLHFKHHAAHTVSPPHTPWRNNAIRADARRAHNAAAARSASAACGIRITPSSPPTRLSSVRTFSRCTLPLRARSHLHRACHRSSALTTHCGGTSALAHIAPLLTHNWGA